MSAHNPSAMGATGQPAPAVPIYVAVCSLVVILALVLGVGLAVNQVLRHLVQTAPFCVAVVLGFRRSRTAYWVALPLFLVWFVLMALIWAYLLGISHIVNGHFSPIEIGMTIVVGVSRNSRNCELPPLEVQSFVGHQARLVRRILGYPAGLPAD